MAQRMESAVVKPVVADPSRVARPGYPVIGIVAMLVVALGITVALGMSTGARLSIADPTREAQASAGSLTSSQRAILEWHAAAEAAVSRSDEFRQAALTAVSLRDFPAAVEPLRNAGAILVVIPESPDKGVSSGLLRKVGMSFMTAALHLQHGDTDAAANSIAEVSAHYAKLTAHLEASGSQSLGQLT